MSKNPLVGCNMRIGGYPIPIHPLCIDRSRNFSNKKSSLGNLCFCKISQLVKLIKDNKPFKMSKRKGDYITVDDLIKEVGKDATRFIMLNRSSDVELDFDFDAVKEKSKDNPLYYVQYCYARISSVFRHLDKDLNSDINASRLAKGKSELKSAPQEILDQLGPEKVSAMAAWLSHKDCKYQAKVFEAGAGYFAQLNWARSTPLFATEKEGVIDAPKPENIREGQKILDNFMSGDMPNSGDGKMGAPSALERVFDHTRD